MTHGARIVTIPRRDPVNAVTMGGIVQAAGLTPRQFRELLCARLILILVSTVGLEPTTTALKGRCSTIELRARMSSV